LGASSRGGAGGTVGGDARGAYSAGAAAAAAMGTRAEWWRPWVADPTHHALLGLLVHAGTSCAGC
jgi:hypothetical protein